MICKICKKDGWGFTKELHGWVIHNKIEYLVGICFDCYWRVPDYIPV